MDKIFHKLYISNWQEAATLAQANPLNIECILNVCEEHYDLPAEVENLNCCFPDHLPIPEEQFTTCMNWLNSKYKQDKTILVHCALGVSRSPSIVAAFLVTQKLASNMDIAIALVKMARSVTNPDHHVFQSARELVAKYKRVTYES